MNTLFEQLKNNRFVEDNITEDRPRSTSTRCNLQDYVFVDVTFNIEITG